MFKSALIIFNIAKGRNVGSLIRTADALGVSELIIVGRKKMTRYGSQGTFNSRIQKHFYCLQDATQYLRDKNYRILGIEINKQSIKIETHPFDGNTAFLPGNEGTGLSDQQKKFSDTLVHISQFGSGASLNVSVATGIVLHHFSTWAEFDCNQIAAQKFKSS